MLYFKVTGDVSQARWVRYREGYRIGHSWYKWVIRGLAKSWAGDILQSDWFSYERSDM